MDPATLALINGASNVLGAAVAAPPNYSAATSTNVLTADSSGFVVNTGQGSVNADASRGGMPDWIWLAAAAFALWYFAK